MQRLHSNGDTVLVMYGVNLEWAEFRFYYLLLFELLVLIFHLPKRKKERVAFRSYHIRQSFWQKYFHRICIFAFYDQHFSGIPLLHCISLRFFFISLTEWSAISILLMHMFILSDYFFSLSALRRGFSRRCLVVVIAHQIAARPKTWSLYFSKNVTTAFFQSKLSLAWLTYVV